MRIAPIRGVELRPWAQLPLEARHAIRDVTQKAPLEVRALASHQRQRLLVLGIEPIALGLVGKVVEGIINALEGSIEQRRQQPLHDGVAAFEHAQQSRMVRPSSIMRGICCQFFRHTSTESLRDLAPIVAVIAFFQLIVLREPIPNLFDLAVGTVMVVIGLTLFVQGLKLGLFPIGETMAWDFARKGSLFWLLAFAFCLGFGTTVAEPALIAVAEEAAEVAANGGMIAASEAARASYAEGLRYTVAFAVGLAIVIGVLRILRGWPIQYLIIGGYLGVVIMTGSRRGRSSALPTTPAG
jgi:hypothetical protein